MPHVPDGRVAINSWIFFQGGFSIFQFSIARLLFLLYSLAFDSIYLGFSFEIMEGERFEEDLVLRKRFKLFPFFFPPPSARLRRSLTPSPFPLSLSYPTGLEDVERLKRALIVALAQLEMARPSGKNCRDAAALLTKMTSRLLLRYQSDKQQLDSIGRWTLGDSPMGPGLVSTCTA